MPSSLSRGRFYRHASLLPGKFLNTWAQNSGLRYSGNLEVTDSGYYQGLIVKQDYVMAYIWIS
ncbi:MAG: hypothetical protein H7836_01480, partial [Magnetococcus sp. YQC-3]